MTRSVRLDARWVDSSWLDNLPAVVPLAWHPQLDVPATRADCPAGACPHVRCRHHLWLIEGAQRSGRRTSQARATPDGRFEPGATGAPLLPPTILRPASGATCALDVVKANPAGMSYAQIGVLLGLTEERVRQTAVAAARKAARACAERGIEAD